MSCDVHAGALAVTSRVGQSNLNIQWGCFIADVLAGLGVETVVVSPGSRSAPLALGFDAQPRIRVEVVLDERAAAFYALGLAKGSGRAVALVCTSGTAAAHYYPALIEASYSEIPLLVLSADRPPELRQCFSGQTIDQNGLFAGYMRWQTEVALPRRSRDAFAYLRQTLRHALDQATGLTRGPVHLNVPFTDPLHPEALPATLLPEKDCLELLRDLPELVPTSPVVSAAGLEALVAHWQVAKRGLIVVGPSQPQDADGFAAAVMVLAGKLGWPVVCDGLTPLRSRCSELEQDSAAGLCIHYDWILRDAARAARLRPDQVLSIGPLPTSKVLRKWLEGCDSETWVIGDSQHNWDGLHRRATSVRCAVQQLVEGLEEIAIETALESDWRQQWLQLERDASQIVEQQFLQAEQLLEPMVLRDLALSIPQGGHLFVANSMPVRDLEFFWPLSPRSITIHCNRGANGIDGNLATGFGVAGSNRHIYIVIGDLALAHDLSVLFNHPRPPQGATIIVVNNGGGGIFRYLPVADYNQQSFEQLFFTPHQLDFSALAAAANISWIKAESRDHYRKLIATPDRSVRLIEVETDSTTSMQFRQQVFNQGVEK